MSIAFFGRSLSACKQFMSGTHRSRSPAATLAAYKPLLPRFGITRIANVTGLDTINVPVYTAIRPNSRTLASSQGKGLDADAAKASAMMEGIELWHAERVALPLRRESYTELRRVVNVVDPARLPLQKGRKFVPERIWLWAEGFDIAQRRAAWVPFDLVCVEEMEPPHVFCQSTNGLASGNHLLEAMVHGLCEVIERDAEALWSATDEMRRIDLATVKTPYCAEVLRRIEAAGAYTAVWDITSDVGIPTYAATVIDTPDTPRWRGVGFYGGYGCHLSPDVALARALTEAVQSRLTFIAGNRDDGYREVYEASTDERVWRNAWEEVAGGAASERFDARASLATDTFDGDLHVLREALAGVGMDSIVVVDLTREDVGIPVVKVIVPGLEGIAQWAEPGPRVRRVIAEQAATEET